LATHLKQGGESLVTPQAELGNISAARRLDHVTPIVIYHTCVSPPSGWEDRAREQETAPGTAKNRRMFPAKANKGGQRKG